MASQAASATNATASSRLLVKDSAVIRTRGAGGCSLIICSASSSWDFTSLPAGARSALTSGCPTAVRVVRLPLLYAARRPRRDASRPQLPRQGFRRGALELAVYEWVWRTRWGLRLRDERGSSPCR